MSNSRDYYHSTSRTSRRSDVEEYKHEERLPSLHHVVGDTYDPRGSSAYNFHDVKHSLPPVSHHDYAQRGPTLAPIHPGSSSYQGAYSAYSGSSRPSTHQHVNHAGFASTNSSSRSNADYPSNHGHSFQTFVARGSDLVAVSPSSTRPQGVVRSYDIPDEDNDPRKRYQCSECGKRFDRPSGLEQHSVRHTGDRPYPCPVTSCDRSFTVRSNMSRHYRTQHGGDEDHHDDDGSSRHSTYSATWRGSSEQTVAPQTYYSSSRRK